MNDLIIDPGPDPYEAGPSAPAQLPPDDIAAEIALLRRTLKNAHDKSASPTVIAQLCSTIATMSKTWQAAAIRSDRMLGVATVHRFAEELVKLFMEAFSDIPGYEERVDKVLTQLGSIRVGNDQKTINLLLGRER